MSRTTPWHGTDEAIEQLLGLVDDPSWVEKFHHVTSGGAAAAVFLGRLLGAAGTLDSGSPLAAWAGLGHLTGDWRERHRICHGSLMDELIRQSRTAGLPIPTSGQDQYRQWRALNGAEPEHSPPRADEKTS